MYNKKKLDTTDDETFESSNTSEIPKHYGLLKDDEGDLHSQLYDAQTRFLQQTCNDDAQEDGWYKEFIRKLTLRFKDLNKYYLHHHNFEQY